MTGEAPLRPRPGRDLSQVVFPPVQADLYEVHAIGSGIGLWCRGQHASFIDRAIASTETGGPNVGLDALFAAALEHETRYHR